MYTCIKLLSVWFFFDDLFWLTLSAIVLFVYATVSVAMWSNPSSGRAIRVKLCNCKCSSMLLFSSAQFAFAFFLFVSSLFPCAHRSLSYFSKYIMALKYISCALYIMDFHWWRFVHRLIGVCFFFFCLTFSLSLSVCRVHYLVPEITLFSIRCFAINSIVMTYGYTQYTFKVNPKEKERWRESNDMQRCQLENSINSHIEWRKERSERQPKYREQEKKSIWKLLHKMDGKIRTKEAQLMEMLMVRAENNKAV